MPSAQILIKHNSLPCSYWRSLSPEHCYHATRQLIAESSALVNVIIAVAVASAIFGVVRQTNQHGMGFGLPLLSPGRGYGQFINPNHFALLMEMAFGLILGIILGGRMRNENGCSSMVLHWCWFGPLWCWRIRVVGC